MNQQDNKTDRESARKNDSEKQQSLFHQLWHNESFDRAAIQFGRVMNYVSLVLGAVLLLLAISWGDFIWGLVAISWIFAGISNIKKVNKRKHDRMYTNCPKCNKTEIKIGTKFCPDCGETIPVQTIEAEDWEAAAREEGSIKTIRQIGQKDSLNGTKVGFLCAIFIGLLILVWLFS